MSENKIRKALIIKHEIETRIVVDIPKDEVKNDELVASDRTVRDIVRIAHNEMRKKMNTDAAYPYSENVTSIKDDSEEPYNKNKDDLTGR